MIDVTVKTLDSQNHQFNVDENWTVEEFKIHIAESVNIPAASQRIIYCGRVLQDTSKLSDYDLDNKVVHLVQRAPPSASTRNVRSLTPPPDINRARTGFRGFDRAGNPVSHMYVGSMTLPQNLMEPQQVVPPRATHTLSSSRLNVARRMLRNAENVIRLLENPGGNVEQQTPTDETVEDEMTPVIEARVIVPTNGDQPIDENEIISAVQNTIFPSMGNNLETPVGPSTSSASTEGSSEPQLSASASETPRSSSAENLNAETNAESLRDNRRSGRRLRCRGTEMSTLLNMLNQLQARFAPFLARYQSFMQDDPQVAPDDLRETRLMLNRVSKVLHYLGHAYHSLSDIIIDADQPPPRLLLCRPILIQPPTLVQAGIPIQLEAQISLSADRPTAPTPANDTSSPTENASSSTPTAPATPSAPAETRESGATQAGTAPQGQPRPQLIPTGVGGSIPPGFMGLPMMSGGSMRVFSTPVEIRTVWPPNSQRGRPATNNNNNSAAAQNATAGAPTSNAQGTSTTVSQETPGTPSQPPPQNPPNPTVGAVPNNDGSMEFFMEVTPEAFRGGNLLQNLMQMIGNQLAGGSTPESSQSGGGNAQGNVHQSQARSTQTNPTTATHTRSTARPHVHMTQQAIQGGFDPFLHCYSHHVSQQSRPQRVVAVGPHLNRPDQAATSRDAGGSAAQSQPTASNTPINLQSTVASHIAGILDNLSGNPVVSLSQLANIFGPRPGRNPQETSNVNTASRQSTNVPEAAAPNAPNANQGARDQPHFLQFLIDIFDQVLQDSPDGVNGPTLDMYMQSLNADPLVEGESLIFDLIMLMVRNLRISDLFSISNGNLAPFERQLVAIRSFFLTQVCQNDTSDSGIARATERIMADFAPIKSALEGVPPRENIDMVRTIDGFFRQRIPPIIRMAINLRPRTEAGESQDTANFVANIWSATRDLLTLAVHCSANGQEGVQNACNEVLMSTFANNRSLPNELHRWTVTNSRTALNSILGDLNTTSSQIEQYVVRKSPNSDISENQEHGGSSNEPVESMEVDYSPSLGAVEQAPIEDPEPLPNVIWGSESWHGQTPEDWVPIITRDVQKQRRQEPQPPFSDAYLSGMPSKRRKLINSAKPDANIRQVISESVHRVVTSAGLSNAAPLDQVVREASESPEIQAAYRNLLQTTVQNNLRNNDDFDPARFPNAALYFSESSTPE